MIHYVYEIKNIINEKIYVGKHSTKNINDGYMGSGKLLNKAIKIHGLENFRKRIIEQFDTEQEAYKFEEQIVDEQFVKDEKTYNLAIGGMGGEFKTIWKNEEFRKKLSQRSSKTMKRLHTEGKISYKIRPFFGKIHCEETKKKIGAANSKHQTGRGNSQFGKIWILNLKEKRSLRIKKEDVEMYIQQGWIKGRKMNFHEKIIQPKKQISWRHTEESKQKMKNIVWMSNLQLQKSRKIQKTDVMKFTQDGWILGRKISWYI